MKAATRHNRVPSSLTAALLITAVLTAAPAHATTQLLLTRGEQSDATGIKGVVDLTVNPGFENARVTIAVDGQKIADGLVSPHRVVVDFGPVVVQHKIAVTAATPSRKRVQWTQTINKGHLPLSVRVVPVDLANRVFECRTTAPDDDPIQTVEVWDAGQSVASTSDAPYRFTVTPEVLASGFVQVTAKTKSGEEAADFWSAAGDVHVESIQVRTVPIFVSVVNSDGTTLDDVDRSLFRILDNGSETKIIEFGKAFDQPISIALLVDGSASMTYSMQQAAKAATAFIQSTLKQGDRCAVYAIQDVPRRKQALTDDPALVSNALSTISPAGNTALYDAIKSALRELNNEKARRAIIVLTDGADTGSIASFEDAEKAARQAGIPIYFIAYNTGNDSQSRDIERLKYLASQTGGFVATATQQNLHARYTDIEKDLRAQFAIRYQVTDYAKQNEWRAVRVVLASPTLTARTIRGYFAP
jgi:Ca-activated chloride channel homolog